MVAAVAARLRGNRVQPEAPGALGPDPRAEELRRRLEESRTLVGERDDFEAGETPVDRAEPLGDPAERRRGVHEAGREALDEMNDAGA